MAFESAPVLFPAERPVGIVFAALALLALFVASASHLGLLFAMWRRVPA